MYARSSAKLNHWYRQKDTEIIKSAKDESKTSSGRISINIDMQYFGTNMPTSEDDVSFSPSVFAFPVPIILLSLS